MAKTNLRHLFLVLFLLLNGQAFAQVSVQVGEKAPEIQITNWIKNAPADKDLTGKNIVLEFWATWCGPCIAAVPHMNELQKEFNAADLYYISISDEPVEKIKRTLNRVDFHSIVVTDENGQTHKNFGDAQKGLQAIPLTILIDKQGIVKWIGLPNQLTKEVMTAFLNGQLVAEAPTATNIHAIVPIEAKSDDTVKKRFASLMSLMKDKETTFYFTMQENQGAPKSKMAIGTQIMEMKAHTLEEIYAQVLGINSSNMEIPALFKEKKFDVLYKNNKGDAQNLLDLEQEMLKEINLVKKVQPVKVKGYQVSVKNKSLLEKTMGEEGFAAKSDADDKTLFTAYTIQSTLKELSKVLSVPFQYTGDDEAKYDFIIKTNSAKEVVNSLKSYGLNVSAKTMKAEQIILESGN
ncbi:TlpA family protein disulfide reductase [Pontibacter sp. HSC-14F20]|uniref:TlpA family protein disulfide reductase n=1 Tax=Pontibacter sp. HSC-14F20 TaxID=2864136 RepID=UPI001C72A9A2|nr:TlpA disulfide reductase family protein [Pontibacter sp. HSC-14F20]MBX0333517.1 TlpA family protein disulfide reductase [Pontibacter sp. HSC-14F20]